MIPDLYTIEKMVGEHRQTLLREAEHQRMLAIVDPPKHVLQSFAGKLGGYLLMLGTRLQQFERRAEAVPYPDESR